MFFTTLLGGLSMRSTKFAIFVPMRDIDLEKLARMYYWKTEDNAKRTIQTLEDMLRACVIDFGKGWVNHLSLCTPRVQKIVQEETTEKIIQIKKRMQVTHDRQKSYADLKHKPMEFQVGDKVMLKVSPWKGVVHFGKRGKLNPKYVGPFKVLEWVGDVAYKLELPQELSRVHNTFHFVEEPVEIMDREVKRLRQSHVPIVKVRWNSRRGPEFTYGKLKNNSRSSIHPFHPKTPHRQCQS
ncbi:hypothetical protein Tco_1447781 [Tanacetum coccineum]